MLLNVAADNVSCCSIQAPSVNNAHNGVAFCVSERVVPQKVIVMCYGVAFRTAGVVTVFQQAGCDTRRLCTHLRAIAVNGVEQRPFIASVCVSLRCYKRATVAERVKIPDTSAVCIAKPVHPGEDTGFNKCPLRDIAKILWPEGDTLFIGHEVAQDT